MFPAGTLRDPAPPARRLPAPPQTRSAAATAPVVLFLFILSILPPSYFFIAGLRLSPTRLLLLLTFVPLLLQLLVGKVGRIRAVDVLLMLFMVWMVVTLVYNHGMARFPYAMMSMVELYGGYLIGRVLIRNAADYRVFFRGVFWAMLFLAPFVVIELLTNQNLLQEISRAVLPTYSKDDSSYGRLGLNRVMAGFEHPILYGLFCAASFGPILALSRRSWFVQLALTVFVGFMTFASLSSAPLLAIAIQIGLMIWGRVTGGRWWTLLGIVGFCYVTVDLLSNRTPVTILINYITFNAGTAWTRIVTWEFGSAEMWRNPIFGIGLNDFQRPDWLTPSVDNFWLVMGLRHGVVGLTLIAMAAATGFWTVGRAVVSDDDLIRWRRAYMLAVLAVYFTLCTVHIWGATSSFVMFLIGAGIWFCDPPPPDATSDAAPDRTTPGEAAVPRGAYSRFPVMRRRPDRALIGDNPGIATLLPPGRHSSRLAVRSIENASAKDQPDKPQR